MRRGLFLRWTVTWTGPLSSFRETNLLALVGPGGKELGTCEGLAPVAVAVGRQVVDAAPDTVAGGAAGTGAAAGPCHPSVSLGDAPSWVISERVCLSWGRGSHTTLL